MSVEKIAFSIHGEWMAAFNTQGDLVMVKNRLRKDPITPARFTGWRAAPDRHLELTLSGTPGQSWILQTTPDLRQWKDWQLITFTNPVISIIDAPGSPEAQRFYRLRSP